MTDPKRNIRGLPDLGKAIDERIRARSGGLAFRHDTGAALPSPQSSGGSAGGGSGAGDPVYPESYVESLRLTDGGTRRTGDIVLACGGVGSISEDTAPGGNRRLTWQGLSVLSVGSLPQSPDAGIIYRCTSDNALWWYDGSAWIELTAQITACDRQTFPAAGNAGGGAYDINVHWAASALDELELAGIAATSECTFQDSPADDGSGILADGYARFSWTSTQETGVVTTQARLYVGTSCRCSGGKANVYARVRLNDVARLDALYLALSDDESPVNSSATVNLSGGLTGYTWAGIELANVDVNQWGDYLRICLTATGTLIPEDTGETLFDVESLSLEQWPG